MQSCNNLHSFSISTIAKQAGVMPGSWLAISGLSYDRTPENTIRVREGWDD
jgi:hypothetical protein